MGVSGSNNTIGHRAAEPFVEFACARGYIRQRVRTEKPNQQEHHAAHKTKFNVLAEQFRLRSDIQIRALPGNETVIAHDSADFARSVMNPLQRNFAALFFVQTLQPGRMCARDKFPIVRRKYSDSQFRRWKRGDGAEAIMSFPPGISRDFHFFHLLSPVAQQQEGNEEGGRRRECQRGIHARAAQPRRASVLRN